MKSFIYSFGALGLAICMQAVCWAENYNIFDLGPLFNGFTVNAIDTSGHATGYSNSTNEAFLYDGTMHDLGALVPSYGSSGYSFNASGQVTGDSANYGGQSAFLYNGGMVDLNAPDVRPLGWEVFHGIAINNSGTVVVAAYNGSNTHAFLYNGSFLDLGTLTPAGDTIAAAISANGQVTGRADLADGSQHAFLYNGTMHDLGTLGTGNSQGNAVNTEGQVTGFFQTANGSQHAFLYDGTMHDLGTLDGNVSQGYAINDSGQVTGFYGLSTPHGGFSAAFLYTPDDGMINLNSLVDPSLNWNLTAGVAIDNAGQIMAKGFDAQGSAYFLLTPVPEPSTLFLSATALAGLFAIGRSRLRNPAWLRRSIVPGFLKIINLRRPLCMAAWHLCSGRPRSPFRLDRLFAHRHRLECGHKLVGQRSARLSRWHRHLGRLCR